MVLLKQRQTVPLICKELELRCSHASLDEQTQVKLHLEEAANV